MSPIDLPAFQTQSLPSGGADVCALAAWLDRFFLYAEYPDFIVDLLQQVDPGCSMWCGPAYLRKETGLMVAHSARVHRILCAAFPGDALLKELRSSGVSEALVVVKHNMDWEETGRGFRPISSAFHELARYRSLALYCAHAAHDNHLSCSPSEAMVRTLNLALGAPLRDGRGRCFGFITELPHPERFDDFLQRVSGAFGIQRVQQRRGAKPAHRVAVIAGGGDNADWLRVALEHGCDTYLTGILHFRGSEYARKYNPAFIDALVTSGLNALGISHYISERSGSIALAEALASGLRMPVAFVPELTKESEINSHWGLHL